MRILLEILILLIKGSTEMAHHSFGPGDLLHTRSPRVEGSFGFHRLCPKRSGRCVPYVEFPGKNLWFTRDVSPCYHATSRARHFGAT